ncbi:hypothetical protein [Stutzerimonas stutzeri]|uniref:hypothetical protein n=1 Tax=Stutzerimonas stutzeri TaxID=316 RepID=UPI000F79BED5|nr:hypothetical protein [Stutzerimonas stutzeri]MCP3433640.1 hypothetical protein [Stutzerimonas stutzeri]RTM21425.1 hypothetical protein EKN22_11960 [Stutzerimonas stutzeri]
MILANRIGVVSTAELTAWADEKVLSTDEPPSFIIDIALGEIPVTPKELDFIRNEASDVEISKLTRLILEALNRTTDLNELGLHCYQLALISKGRSCELLYWISDEIHLCSEGVKSLSESEPLIRGALNEIVALAPN